MLHICSRDPSDGQGRKLACVHRLSNSILYFVKAAAIHHSDAAKIEESMTGDVRQYTQRAHRPQALRLTSADRSAHSRATLMHTPSLSAKAEASAAAHKGALSRQTGCAGHTTDIRRRQQSAGGLRTAKSTFPGGLAAAAHWSAACSSPLTRVPCPPLRLLSCLAWGAVPPVFRCPRGYALQHPRS